MKKLTLAKFLERVRPLHPSYDFSQFEYLGTQKKSAVICPSHGVFRAHPASLLHGSGCPGCWSERRGVARSHTFEWFLESARATHGDRYDYSSVVWANATTPVDIKCDRHGVFTQKPTLHIKAGHGCPTCGKESAASALSYSQEDFLSKCREVHGDRYDLSRVIYKGAKVKVNVVCRDHGSFWPSPGNFTNRASGCPKCRDAQTSERSRNTFEQYLQQFHDAHGERYEYAEVFYDDGRAMVRAMCPEHGEFTQLASDHARGIGCQKCFYTIYDQDSFIAAARKAHGDKYDYSKVVYKRAVDRVKIVCPIHGEFEQAPTYHAAAGQGCRKCATNGPSKPQVEIHGYLSQYAPCVMDHVFSGKKEIDIFVPSLNLGVEFHGLIWHSTKYAKNPTHIHEKTRLASAGGIRLVHIFQDEWEFRKDAVKKTLRSLMGVDERVYARHTSCVFVPQELANKFLEANHLQGAVTGAAYSLGLVHNEKLVAIMVFSSVNSIRGQRADPSQVELRRYASSRTVIGGASKLLRSYVDQHTEVERIVSYSENRLFTGAVYEHMGFTRDGVTAPDYWYIRSNSKKRHSKVKFQRKNLPAILGEQFDPSMSEVDNCLRAGWFRLFDCGKTRWVWCRQK